MIRFGLSGPAPSLAPAEPGFGATERFERWLAHAEDVGADLITLSEAPTIFEDQYIWLAFAARATKRVLLGHSTTVPGLRHPALHASTLATVHRMSGGRVFLGIGTGAVGLIDIGERPWPLDRFERYVQTVTALTAGEEVEYEGKRFKLRWSAGRVPLYLGAEGPRALRLAGRIADGVIVGTGLTPDVIRFTREHIAAGAAEAGRSIDDVDVWYMTRIQVAETIEAGLRTPFLEEYLSRYARHLFAYSQCDKTASVAENLRRQRGIEIDEDTGERLGRYNAEYSQEEAVARAYRAGADHNLTLLDKYGLREWIATQGWITGPFEHVVERLHGLVDAGARNFACALLSPEKIPVTTEIGEVFTAVR